MNRSAERARLRAPLVVGVTGHRDLRTEDIPRLEKKVKRIFERLGERYPSTPFLVLSLLAEGADRLVAQVGLLPEFGARLVVPLPMPAALYEEDFQEPGSVEEFRALLARADSVFEVSPAVDPASIRDPGPARDRRYEVAGAYVVAQCQILIVLWDGVDSGKIGGTSAMIKLRTEGPSDARECHLQPPELFPVYHIVTPRRSNPNPAGEPFRLREIYPPVFHREERAEHYYSQAIRNLDRFNLQIQIGGDALLGEAAASKRDLLGRSGEALSPRQALDLDQYGIADALAIQFQGKTVQAHWALHILVLGSFFCFVAFGERGEFRIYWLLLSLVVLAAALITHRLSRRHALDSRSQDYRALAEGARVRYFWDRAGIHESVPDNYLESIRTELDWIRQALRGWEVAAGPNLNANADRHASLSFVLKHWVEHQRRYFLKKANDNRKMEDRVHRIVIASVTLPIGIAAVVAIAGGLDHAFGYGWWELPTREWLSKPMMAIDMLLSFGAVLHHFGERMAYREHARQYRKMESVFRAAHAIIERQLAANDLDGARNCLRKLGQEALAENAEWVLLHRERPLELPHP
jgi:hypothetical protein